jgi:hypothetical protein
MTLNWKQMRYKLTKKNWKSSCEYDVEKKTLEKHKRKHISISLHFLRMG